MKLKKLKSFLSYINFCPSEGTPNGCSGYYFRLPHGLGIKIYEGDTSKKPSNVVSSYSWWVASRAKGVMNKARDKGIGAPKAHCVVPVKFCGDWAVGLVMDHIEGDHKEITNKRYKRLRDKLNRNGVEYSDMGSHNWKVQKSGRIVLIDWDWTRIRKGKR